MTITIIGIIAIVSLLIVAIYLLLQNARNRAEVIAANQTKDKLVQSIIDNIPSALYIKDLEGRYLFVNKMCPQVLEKAPDSILGQTTATLYKDTPHKLDVYEETDRDVTIRKQISSFEETVSINNKQHTYWFTKFPLLDETGAVEYIGVLATDITDRKETENKLREAKHDAEEAKLAQETFLATMSHELRTPMNGVIGMANLLLTTPLTNEQEDFTTSIQESATSLLSLINDLLDFSKIRAGKLELENIPFDLRKTISKAIYPLSHRAKEKMIKLNLTIAGDVPPVLIGDPLRLQQVIINLASNAVKYTSKGSVEIAIDVINVAKGQVIIKGAVKDSGIGIPENMQAHIFESFTQTSAEDARKYGGTGLGLAIVKQLIDMQQGEISVKSTVGIGSIFYFDIPYQIGETSSVQQEAFVASNKSSKNRLSGLDILVAEDNIINQKVVINTLEKQGATVTLAHNGKEAIEALNSSRYHLLLMDLQMPEVDGYVATQHIRTVLNNTIPIIAMTADALKGEEDKCMEMGMNGYVSKPFEPEVLYQTILALTEGAIIDIVVENTRFDAAQQVDFSMLEELAEGDNNYIIEVLDIFLSTMPEGMQVLRGHVNEQNWEGISKQAHFLKSSLGIIKIEDAYDIMAAIERGGKEITSIEEISTLFANVEQKIAMGYWYAEQKKKFLMDC